VGEAGPKVGYGCWPQSKLEKRVFSVGNKQPPVEACVALHLCTNVAPYHPNRAQLHNSNVKGLPSRAKQHSAATPHTSVIKMFSDMMTATVQVLTSWRRWRDRCPKTLISIGAVSLLSHVAGCTFGVKLCPMFCCMVAVTLQVQCG